MVFAAAVCGLRRCKSSHCLTANSHMCSDRFKKNVRQTYGRYVQCDHIPNDQTSSMLLVGSSPS